MNWGWNVKTKIRVTAENRVAKNTAVLTCLEDQEVLGWFIFFQMYYFLWCF